MQHLAEHLSQSELTQAAHRNRPLTYDGRIVVTMCQGDVEYLPATETITSFPQLGTNGEAHEVVRLREVGERLRSALERIRARGEQPSVRKLTMEAHVRTEVVTAWWRDVLMDEGRTFKMAS